MSLVLTTNRLWSPEDPFLYDVEVVLREKDKVVDRVKSYFGMRELGTMRNRQGQMLLALNRRPCFVTGVLDQGYWPDGLYTAPSDEALRHDLELAKKLGFNAVRKHVKVEPARWYYWCDRLGVLVWQDMPSSGNADAGGRQQFEVELRRMVEALQPHPSVAMWVLFNEGWGQFETRRLCDTIRKLDSSRWINNASGWTDAKVGDVLDVHGYPALPQVRAENSRAAVVGEFGGLGLFVTNHLWTANVWCHREVSSSEWLATHLDILMQDLVDRRAGNGLSGAVYAQLTDVESDCNGLQTYDRAVLKIGADQFSQGVEEQRVAMVSRVVAANAQQAKVRWKYTLTRPAEAWMTSSFDDADWPVGVGGFGQAFTRGAIVGTEWKSAHIWLRREIVLPASVPPKLVLNLHHDEDAEVYLNGVLAARVKGFTTDYVDREILPAALAALKPGTNTLAVWCLNTFSGQYIDVGLRSLDAEGTTRQGR